MINWSDWLAEHCVFATQIVELQKESDFYSASTFQRNSKQKTVEKVSKKCDSVMKADFHDGDIFATLQHRRIGTGVERKQQCLR